MRYLLLSVLVVSLVGILMIPSVFAALDDEHADAFILVKIGDAYLRDVSPEYAPVDFSLPQWQLRSAWIHFESGDGVTIHRHASGITLGYLFENLGFEISPECFKMPNGYGYCTKEKYGSLKYFINRQPVNGINDYVIEDGDRILISYEFAGYGNQEQIEDKLRELDLLVGTSLTHNFDHSNLCSSDTIWDTCKSNLFPKLHYYDQFGDFNPLLELDSLSPDKEFKNIKTEVLRTAIPEQISEVELNEMFDIEKLRTQLSPEALELFSTSLYPKSPAFGKIFDSPRVTTEEKQIVLGIYEKLTNLYKTKVKDIIAKLDKAVAEAEIKINAMDISQEQKAEYISELQSEVKTAKNAIVSTAANLITPSEKLIEEQKALQKTRLELAGEGGGCLIATATFGSEMAPQVQFLRELRDNTVLQTESGTNFMTSFNQFYYSFSPTVADYERENPAFKEAVKLTLTPLLTSLTLLQYADIDSESEMLGYGIGVILLNIGMYFVAPAVLIMTVRKRI